MSSSFNLLIERLIVLSDNVVSLDSLSIVTWLLPLLKFEHNLIVAHTYTSVSLLMLLIELILLGIVI